MSEVICFGEGMLELTRQGHHDVHLGVGGDVLNTATYLARLGVPTSFMTALGRDPWSTMMVEALRAERIRDDFVLYHPTRATGMYGITTDPQGERSFTYWRETSAARAFFDCDGADHALEAAASASQFYLSGITLAIFSHPEQVKIVALAHEMAARGGIVVFDPNYRARLWGSPEQFKQVVRELSPAISIALPSFEDEALVWGDVAPEATFARWQGLGVQSIVVKDGPRGALTSTGWVPAPRVDTIIDTTGAGDSFNAGFLAARWFGYDTARAVEFAAQLAAKVVQVRGAILPQALMPTMSSP